MSDRRVALVTGTSSGIGLEVALGLARRGVHVVATARDVARGGGLLAAAAQEGLTVDLRALDVTVPEQAQGCVAAVVAEHGRLDVLVNNAGRGKVATLEQLDDGELQEQLEVNYLSVARLTRLVLPVMRSAGRGRVVTVTSVGGVVGQPFADAYCGAKFAVEGLMQSLAPVVARFGIEVAVVEPAAVSSEFVRNTGAADVGSRLDDDYAPLLEAYLERTGRSFASAQPPKEAAAVVVEAALTEQPRFRWQSSPTAEGFAGLSLADLSGERVLDQTRTWLT